MDISGSFYNNHINFNALPIRSQDRKTDKLEAAVGSAVGTGIGLLCMMKRQKVKNPFNVKYSLLEMAALSACSIAGGVALSLHGDDNETDKRKMKEGVFQFCNAAIPTWLAGACLKHCETTKHFNNAPAKILSVLGAIIVGMHGAASLANKLFDPKDLEPDRKLKLKDGIANIDDLVGILVLAKIPFLKNIPFDRALPFIYTYCGYKAGKTR